MCCFYNESVNKRCACIARHLLVSFTRLYASRTYSSCILFVCFVPLRSFEVLFPTLVPTLQLLGGICLTSASLKSKWRLHISIAEASSESELDWLLVSSAVCAAPFIFRSAAASASGVFRSKSPQASSSSMYGSFSSPAHQMQA